MVFGFFKKKPPPEIDLAEAPEAVDFRAPVEDPNKKVAPRYSIKDIADGNTKKRWCFDCGKEFQEVPFRGRKLYACKSCWRKQDFQGKPPANAAPHGHMAFMGIWEEGQNPRRASVVVQAHGGLMKRGGSAASLVAAAAEPASPPDGRRSTTTGMAGGTTQPEDEGQLSWMMPNPRMMDFKGLEMCPTRSTPTGRRSTAAELDMVTSSESLNSRHLGQDVGRRRTLQSRDGGSMSRMPSDASGVESQEMPASMPVGPLSRASPPTSKEPTVSMPVGGFSRASFPRGKESAQQQLLLNRAQSVPDFGGRPSTGVDRRGSVMKKLGQTRMVQEAVVAVAKEIARSKMTHQQLFEFLDADGNGELTKLEMQMGLRKLGITIGAVQLDAVLRAFDVDGNGTLDPQEFAETLEAWLPQARATLDAEEAARRAAEGIPTYTGPPLPGGLEVGMRVRSLALLPGQEDSKEEGMIIGPGLKQGTVKVNFSTLGQMNLKPALLRVMAQADKK